MDLPRLPILMIGVASLVSGCPLIFGSGQPPEKQTKSSPAPSGCHYSGGGKGPPILVCDEPPAASAN